MFIYLPTKRDILYTYNKKEKTFILQEDTWIHQDKMRKKQRTYIYTSYSHAHEEPREEELAFFRSRFMSSIFIPYKIDALPLHI
jgi:hypothetical protein